MNRNDQNFVAQRIRAQYVEKTPSKVDALVALDKKVNRPANVFAYTFGSIGAIVMGAGMSLVMTEIGSILSIAHAMPIGIAVGIVGLAMALVTYPIYKKILSSRKKKFAPEILKLSEEIMN